MNKLLYDLHSVGKQFISGARQALLYYNILLISSQCNAYTYRCPTKNHAA